MPYLGCHLSISAGFEAIGRQAIEIGANTFQFFTRNPRGGAAKKISPEDVSALKAIMSENGFCSVVAHAPYTMNLCSAKEETRKFALDTLRDDLSRTELLPGALYNFHPGSHTGLGVDRGIKLIADALNSVLSEDMTTTVLLETMAGKGTEIGRSFEELKMIIDRVGCKSRLGVCMDTCHVFDAGYDIVNDFDAMLGEFDRIIGIDRLRAMHINDSQNPLGSRKDRHQRIGEGFIGFEALEKIITNKHIRSLPLILETPNDLDGYEREIKMLKSCF